MAIPPIDVVVTWVDGSLPAFVELRSRTWAAGVRENATWLQGTQHDSNVDRRFMSPLDELRFMLRSVHNHLPWVRFIYLLTCCDHRPRWLVEHTSSRVRVISYEALLRDLSGSLPNFNSNAIETTIHTIPGLSELFIYFNDDMLVSQPLRPDSFFTLAGLPIIRLQSEWGPVSEADVPANSSDAYLFANRNVRQELVEHLPGWSSLVRQKPLLRRRIAHQALPLTRQLCYRSSALFARSVNATRHAATLPDTLGRPAPIPRCIPGPVRGHGCHGS